MPRANSGLTWIRQPHVTTFLTGLARAETITHESLDQLPASRTRDYVRGDRSGSNPGHQHPHPAAEPDRPSAQVDLPHR